MPGPPNAAVTRSASTTRSPHNLTAPTTAATWKEIVKGCQRPGQRRPRGPRVAGLLYCGTERAASSPQRRRRLAAAAPQHAATSIRDLVIHDDDVVVGTHADRSDPEDVTPRGSSTQRCGSPSPLFKRRSPYRIQWNLNTDTPSPEEPGARTARWGHYQLLSGQAGPAQWTLEIFDANDKPVAPHEARTSRPRSTRHADPPSYWIRPPQSSRHRPARTAHLGHALAGQGEKGDDTR